MYSVTDVTEYIPFPRKGTWEMGDVVEFLVRYPSDV